MNLSVFKYVHKIEPVWKLLYLFGFLKVLNENFNILYKWIKIKLLSDPAHLRQFRYVDQK